MTMPPDAPTAWELARNYDRLREDMRSGFAGINSRMDRVVTADHLQSMLEGIVRRVAQAEKDVSDLESEIKAERSARAADRRVVIAAALAAVGSLAVLVASTLIGLPA